MEYGPKIQSFKDLVVWQESRVLTVAIYKITKEFPHEEMFGLISQMRRAAVSVSSNIAEGFSRNSSKEKLQFFAMARGSLTELENQIILASDIGYLAPDEYEKLSMNISSVHRLLNAFIRKTREL